MNPLVSICIPAYKRPELFREALLSCVTQTYPHLEIVVTDDSPDDSLASLIAEIDTNVPIRYHHNNPRLGQPHNWSRCFDLARGNRMVILHGDDRLLPHAVEAMDAAWRSQPDLCLVYGKPQFIDHAGHVLHERSESDNRFKYHRKPEHAGRQPSELWAALVQQVPPDGFMIATAVGREVRYDPSPHVGNILDAEFGLRLAESHRGFFYLDEYVYQYRHANDSISSHGIDYHLFYDLLARMDLPTELLPFRDAKLKFLAKPATQMWLRAGQPARAKDVYYSPYYPLVDKLTAKGLGQLVMLYAPSSWFCRAHDALDACRRLLHPQKYASEPAI